MLMSFAVPVLVLSKKDLKNRKQIPKTPDDFIINDPYTILYFWDDTNLIEIDNKISTNLKTCKHSLGDVVFSLVNGKICKLTITDIALDVHYNLIYKLLSEKTQNVLLCGEKDLFKSKGELVDSISD